MKARHGLRAGDWVEVRSKEEILSTLDRQGRLEGLPFMPEMLPYCGQRYQVFKRAHKTCDPPSGLQARRLASAVHLTGLRCDGAAHGGCQAGCLIFWKEAWLRRIGDGDSGSFRVARGGPSPLRSEPITCTEKDLVGAVHRMTEPSRPELPAAYVCQSTQLFAATTPLPWWDLRQYLEDLGSGNVRVSQMISAALFFVYQSVAEAGLGLGSAMRWMYDTVQRIRGGPPYPLRPGRIPKGGRTPSAQLDLKPGELVRVRSLPEIVETLDQEWHNRGMYFDSEQVPFCNGTYRVLRRVERIIDEKTGVMMRLRNDAIVLDDVVCQALYAKCRLFCSRSIYPYWREIWLERLASTGRERAGTAVDERGDVASSGRRADP